MITCHGISMWCGPGDIRLVPIAGVQRPTRGLIFGFLQIAVGLIVFGLTAPLFVMLVQRVLSNLNSDVYTLFRLM